MTRILWLIPARSGSRGVPHKNIRMLGGIPLLAWRILSAIQLGGDIWVSTDSEAYAACGRRYGAAVPFLRPSGLSSDTTSSAEVCLHAMRCAKAKGLEYDVLGLLQPTSPFVSAQTLGNGLKLLEKTPSAHSVISVSRPKHPSFLIQHEAATLSELAIRLRNQQDCRRQALPAEMTPSGGFYLVRWEMFLTFPSLYTESSLPIMVNSPENLDIDTETDLAFAEFLVATGRIPLPGTSPQSELSA